MFLGQVLGWQNKKGFQKKENYGQRYHGALLPSENRYLHILFCYGRLAHFSPKQIASTFKAAGKLSQRAAKINYAI